jgi:hypothetical protein
LRCKHRCPLLADPGCCTAKVCYAHPPAHREFVALQWLDTSRGNKPKNKQDDEDNDKDVKEDTGNIGTRSGNASKAENGRDY